MRARFTERKLYLRNEQVRNNLLALIRNLPLDDIEPLEIVVREQIKGRRITQNDRMWAGPLRDIAEQAWVAGRQHSAAAWHEYFKSELLPEDFDPTMCHEGYQKWDLDPGGNRVLVGSTTQLTIKGFAEYLTALEAFGASLGVQFTASPNER